jgi:Phage integrase family
MLKEGNIAARVFCTRTGRFLGKSDIARKVLKTLLTKANDRGVKLAGKSNAEPRLLPRIRFHDLRHTHATSLLSHGHSIKAVSQRLGHADIEATLAVYAHVLPSDDASLADGLDGFFGLDWLHIGYISAPSCRETRKCRRTQVVILAVFLFQNHRAFIVQ